MNINVRKTLALAAGAVGVAGLSIGMTLAAERMHASVAEPVAPAAVVSAAQAIPAQNAVPVSTPPTPLMGQVISVKPHYVTTMVPYRTCHQVEQVYYDYPQPVYPGAGAVLGGVAGGFIGNSFGHGHGRAAATVAGAVIGAMGGNAIQQDMNRPRAYGAYSTVCSKHYKKQIVQKGYEVTYLFNGQQDMAVMPTAPTGEYIPLSVSAVS